MRSIFRTPLNRLPAGEGRIHRWLHRSAAWRSLDAWTLGLLWTGTIFLPYVANIGACLYLLALIPFLFCRWRRRADPVARDPVLGWMVAYTVAALALTGLTPYPLFNLYGLFTRFVFYFLVYWLIRSTFTSYRRKLWMYWAILAGGWACSWLGVWQYFGGHFQLTYWRLPFEQYPGMMPYFFIDFIMLPQYDGRSRSILMGPTIFGVWLVLVLPLVLHAPAAVGSRWVQYLAKLNLAVTRLRLMTEILQTMLQYLAELNLAVTVVVLILTFTRNAWVCGLLVLALYVALTRRWKLAGVFAGLASISLVGLILIRPAIWQHFVERVLSIPSLSYASNAQRLYMWQLSLAQIYQHPLAGVGNYGYRLALPELWNAGWPHAHNYWIHTALETGIPLTILITAIMVFITVRGWKRLREMPLDSKERGWQAAAFSGAIGFFLMGVVDYTAYEPRNFHIFWLYLALL